MVTRPAGGCDFVMTVHLNWVICRLASFIIAIVMLIAASVLLVWMFSAFHFLRIIFLNFNLHSSKAVTLILDLRLRAKNCARYTVYLYPLKLSESG